MAGISLEGGIDLIIASRSDQHDAPLPYASVLIGDPAGYEEISQLSLRATLTASSRMVLMANSSVFP